MASALTGNDFDYDDGHVGAQLRDDGGGDGDEQHHSNGGDGDEHHQSPISFENGHLSIVGHDIEELPLDVAQTYGPQTTTLNLSFNRLTYALPHSLARPRSHSPAHSGVDASQISSRSPR